MKRNSFTVAEVLITLGIIGLISAMTLPSLIKNYSKKVTTERLKQTYSMLEQAIKLSEVKNGELEYWSVPKIVGENNVKITENFVKMYIEPYLQVIGKNELNSSSASYPYYYHDANGKLVLLGGHTHYSIALINGVYLHFNAGDYESAPADISVRVDINGKKNPNTLGEDLFTIRIYPKFDNYDRTSRSNLLRLCKSDSYYYQALTCFQLIKYDGFEIKKDYPWF